MRSLRSCGGHAESDGYNALVLAAGLPWRDVVLVRALSRFLRQVRVPYSQDYMWATLRKHAGDRDADRRACSTRASIRSCAHRRTSAPRARLSSPPRSKTRLQSVESLDEDRILRRFVNAVQAAVRTDFYQRDRDGRPEELVAVKFASRKLDDMPLPRPLYEIFVYSPRRRSRASALRQGGARRHPLVRPAAGFPHRNPRPGEGAAGEECRDRAGRRQGRLRAQASARRRRPATPFKRREPRPTSSSSRRCSTSPTISARGRWASCRPPTCVRHDGDDPYLVVAADKGTATFSDIANDIANAHDFWLGDAFASGGSAGYDHKKMGITARGAWESVKRHFRELDVDIGRTPFTVAGVGDMSGDVFGNGMLRETDDQARRRVRPPRHLHRSGSRSRARLRRADAAVRAAAVELAGFRQGGHLQGRRRLSAHRQGDQAFAGSADAVRLSANGSPRRR